MNTSDYGDLLRACAFYDNRKVTKEAAVAWAHAIKPYVTKADALQAIADHHAESTDYILPAHVNDRVRQVQRDRLQRAGDPPMPGGLTWQREREWRERWCAAIKAGLDKDQAAAQASTVMGLPAELPPAKTKAELEAFIAAGSQNFTTKGNR